MKWDTCEITKNLITFNYIITNIFKYVMISFQFAFNENMKWDTCEITKNLIIFNYIITNILKYVMSDIDYRHHTTWPSYIKFPI